MTYSNIYKSSLSGLTALTLIAFALAVSSCTKKEDAATPPAAPAETTTTTTTTTDNAAAPAAASTASNDQQPSQTIELSSVGDTMAYDKTTLTAKAGSVVKIVLKNNSAPTSNLHHNWVLSKPGKEAEVATQGIQAGEAKGWVSSNENVLAHTPLAKAGETVEVTFTVPAAGDYPYICTFPGHATMMKGVLKSTP